MKAPRPTAAPRLRAWACEDGAVAVEMALVLPLLLLLVCGIIDFGRMLNAQILVSSAAREGVRMAALNHPELVPSRVGLAAASLSPAPGAAIVSACDTDPQTEDNAQVLVSHTFSFATPLNAIAGLFGGSQPTTMTLTGRGVMRCGG